MLSARAIRGTGCAHAGKDVVNERVRCIVPAELQAHPMFVPHGPPLCKAIACHILQRCVRARVVIVPDAEDGTALGHSFSAGCVVLGQALAADDAGTCSRIITGQGMLVSAGH